MARRSRPQTSTWEEARGEFYQEHFPSSQAGLESDDGLSSGVSSSQAQLLNILPSRQLLHTVDGVTMSRGQMTRTLGKRRSTLTVRPSQAASQSEVDHHETLPDQDIPDEQQIWDQIQAIKAMPIPMDKKRERKNKLLNSPAFRIQGLQRFHLTRQKFWSRFKDAMVDIFSFELWHDSLRLIEGNFGTGVLSYFHYIKKVMYMNLAVFAAMLVMVVLPNALLPPSQEEQCNAENRTTTITACCHEEYVANVTSTGWRGVGQAFMDFLQGQGYMELTPLFYGYYENEVLMGPHTGLYYNLPLAYVLVTLTCLLLCLVYVVIHTAHGFQDAILSRGKFYQYCNVIFSAWDFCIDNVGSAENKQKAVFNELKGYLETDQYEAERRNRSQMDTIQLYVVRTVTNIIVTVILIISGVIIYFVVQYSLVNVETAESGVELYIYQYLPPFTVSGLNIVVTLFMYHIVTLERYTPQVQVTLTLLRTVFLRVASIAVLMYSFFAQYKAQCEGQLDPTSCYQDGCQKNACWETVVGQMCWRLMLTDFAALTGLNLLVYFPLRVLIDHFPAAWMRSLFLQEFEIPRHVLDVVYNQSLCWLGVFFSPLLPGVAALLCFFFFYLKRFTCTRICTPPTLSLHSIRSSAFYMLVSLISFFASLLIVVFSLAEIRPSRSCGPYRGLDTMWREIQKTVDALPSWLRNFFYYFGSAGFAVPLVIVLLLAMYYYSAIAAANKHMIEVLKEQLVLEGHDKQFLLGKLNELNSLTRSRLGERRQNVVGERMTEGVHFAEMGSRPSSAGQVVAHQGL